MENKAESASLSASVTCDVSEWHAVFAFSMDDLRVFDSALRLHAIVGRIIPNFALAEEDRHSRQLLSQKIKTEIFHLTNTGRTGIRQGEYSYLLGHQPTPSLDTGFIDVSPIDYRLLTDALSYLIDVTTQRTSPTSQHYRTILDRLHSTVALPLAVLHAEHGIPIGEEHYSQ